MDIRTKLVFALVAVALGSMLALGAFTYDATRAQLQRLALRQLDALAESKKEDLERVIACATDVGGLPLFEEAYGIRRDSG